MGGGFGRINETGFIKSFRALNYKFANENLTALDLGCSSSLNLSFLNQNFNFSKLVAVDKTDIISSKYGDGFQVNRGELPSIDFIENKDVFDFFEENSGKFDLIILSKFIHLFELAVSKQILEKSTEILSRDGLIYVCVANHGHLFNEKSDGPIKWRMNSSELTTFVAPLKVFDGQNLEVHTEVFLTT